MKIESDQSKNKKSHSPASQVRIAINARPAFLRNVNKEILLLANKLAHFKT
jgi:hypothetical protein